MRTKISFIKISLLSLILVFNLMPDSVAADNSSNANNASDNVKNEYLLVANNKTHLADNIFNISPEDTLEFRILDNTSKKFTTSGTIKFEKLESKPITSHNFIEVLKDVLQGLWSKIADGENTSGKNSEYYAEFKFPETTENYPVEVIGEYNSIPTINNITINVRTKYLTIIVGDMDKTYLLASMNNLSGRQLKYHSVNHGKNADELTRNITKFLGASNELQSKISNLTNSPKDTEIYKLPVYEVLETHKTLVEDSIVKFYNAAKDDDKLKELKEQLDSMKKDSNQVLEELSSKLNRKKGDLLKEELKSTRKLEEDSTNAFVAEKSEFREDVFIPAGALFIVIGLIIGYFNVNRWKKESEYFGLYTSKANITSPITIAIILTVVISILIGIIVYIEGDLNMFKFLI